jgi:hypothetical protein
MILGVPAHGVRVRQPAQEGGQLAGVPRPERQPGRGAIERVVDITDTIEYAARGSAMPHRNRQAALSLLLWAPLIGQCQEVGRPPAKGSFTQIVMDMKSMVAYTDGLIVLANITNTSDSDMQIGVHDVPFKIRRALTFKEPNNESKIEWRIRSPMDKWIEVDHSQTALLKSKSTQTALVVISFQAALQPDKSDGRAENPILPKSLQYHANALVTFYNLSRGRFESVKLIGDGTTRVSSIHGALPGNASTLILGFDLYETLASLSSRRPTWHK